MSIEKFIEDLRNRLDAAGDQSMRLKTAATGIAGYFELRDHEVGIFSVNRKKHEITFLWPLGMATVGHIPLNAINSLVAKTANDVVTTLDNSFANSRHLFIFEFMLVEKSDRIPIQKIMSVPVTVDGEAKAVIQVVRKGKSLPEAGADFTEQQLADLVKIAALISGYSLPGV